MGTCGVASLVRFGEPRFCAALQSRFAPAYFAYQPARIHFSDHTWLDVTEEKIEAFMLEFEACRLPKSSNRTSRQKLAARQLLT
jgi:hypothetical protein